MSFIESPPSKTVVGVFINKDAVFTSLIRSWIGGAQVENAGAGPVLMKRIQIEIV
jgi:hypothetical protein